MSEKKKRRRGERADGRIEVTYTDGRNEDGTPRRLHFYGATRAEAEKKRDDYKNRGKAGIAAAESLRVSDWIDRWISVYDINAEMYKPYIDRARQDLGRMLLADVVEADLVQTLRSNFQGKSSSGATKYRMVLQQIFKKARVNRLIIFDPAEDLQLPKLADPEGHRALERWEIDCILNNWQQHRAGLWALIMLLAGLRRGELVALDWSHIDLTARTLTVAQTAVLTRNQTVIEPRAKTQAGLRSVPLCETLYSALASVPAPQRTGAVCKSSRNTLLTQHAFTRGWEGFNAAMSRILADLDPDQRGRRSDLIGAPPSTFSVRPHDLRHTFATLLYDGGVDVKTASYLLGHSDSRITMEIYTHLSESRKTSSAAALINVLDGIKPQ